MIEKKKIILQNIAICIALLASFVCIGFVMPPVWLTNDDVGMMMLFDGFGIAFEPTNNLVFSHVFYAKFMRLLPNIFGLSQYVVTYYLIYSASMVAIVCLVSPFQEAKSRNILVDFFFYFFIFLFPAFNPQFTLNAGIAALAAYLALFLYLKGGLFRYFFLYFLFAVISFSIRREEFYLISIAALAVFFLRKINIKRCFLAFAIIPFLVFMALADRAFYDSTWDDFKDFQSIRPLLIDNGGFERVLKKDTLSGSLSKNDCSLLNSWFFADPALIKVEDWKHLYDNHVNFNMLSRIKKGIRGVLLAIFDLNLLPLLIFIAASCIHRPHLRKTFYISSIFILVFIVGVYGRIDVVRVFYPVAALFCVFMFAETSLCEKSNNKYIYIIAICAFFVLLLNFLRLYTSNDPHEKMYQELEHASRHDNFILYGDNIDSRTLYPPFIKKKLFPKVALIGLGWNSLIPSSRSYSYIQNDSFKSAIQSNTGVFFITRNGLDPREIEMLKIYSGEHLSKKLEVEFDFLKFFVIVNVKCK